MATLPVDTPTYHCRSMYARVPTRTPTTRVIATATHISTRFQRTPRGGAGEGGDGASSLEGASGSATVSAGVGIADITAVSGAPRPAPACWVCRPGPGGGDRSGTTAIVRPEPAS